MLHSYKCALTTRDTTRKQIDRAAETRWENEGGTARSPTLTTPGSLHHQTSARDNVQALNDRQDALMSAASSDGRPPSHFTRMIEWRWFGGIVVLFIAGAVSWFFIEGMNTRVVIIAIATALLIIGGASPILGAGLLRGREERAARRQARIQLGPSHLS